MDDLELEAKRNGRKEAFACIGSQIRFGARPIM